MTLHTMFKLTPYSTIESVERNIGSQTYAAKAVARIAQKLDVLIIDEISMVSLDILKMIDIILRTNRTDYYHIPFGGVKIVFSGDFLQLPPVFKDSKPEHLFLTKE